MLRPQQGTLGLYQTLTVTPRIWATSKREAFSRQCLVEAMMESLYWTGMSHPWKSTILPAGMATRNPVSRCNTEYLLHERQQTS